MKTFAFTGIAALALVAVPALAFQHAGQGHRDQPVTRAAVQAMVQSQFGKADANRDGFVTRAEFDGRAAAFKAERQDRRAGRKAERFASLDADKDGALSRVEFDAPRAGRGEGPEGHGQRHGHRMGHGGRGKGHGGMRLGANWFANADADKDGRISLAEASSRPMQMFERADGDRDGTVTAQERRAAWQAKRSQRQSNGG